MKPVTKLIPVLSIPEMRPETFASLVNFAVATFADGEAKFGVNMIAPDGSIMAWGFWSREDWLRMRSDMDRLWAAYDYSGTGIVQ